MLFTIGFARKTAREFFELLRQNEVKVLVDVRLSNSGQLAGFTKKEDLKYFLTLFDITYEHWTDFAPTKTIRDAYRTTGDWDAYAKAYRSLIKSRRAIERVDANRLLAKNVVLLCSEPEHHRCHRRIVAEKIKEVVPEIKVIHL